MSYEINTWSNGDVITADKLNHIENGIKSIENKNSQFIINITENPSAPITLFNGKIPYSTEHVFPEDVETTIANYLLDTNNTETWEFMWEEHELTGHWLHDVRQGGCLDFSLGTDATLTFYINGYVTENIPARSFKLTVNGEEVTTLNSYSLTLIVIPESGGGFTADKTFAEVQNQIENGNYNIIAIENIVEDEYITKQIYSLISCESGHDLITFTFCNVSGASERIFAFSNEGIEKWENFYQLDN